MSIDQEGRRNCRDISQHIDCLCKLLFCLCRFKPLYLFFGRTRSPRDLEHCINQCEFVIFDNPPVISISANAETTGYRTARLKEKVTIRFTNEIEQSLRNRLSEC